MKALKKLKNYCCFIGYVRTGHTLVSSLLDAHENIAISNEKNIVRKLTTSKRSRDKLFKDIIEHSAAFAKHKREWTEYSYYVEDGSHGKFTSLHTIGDKQAGSNTGDLVSLKTMNKFEKAIGLPVRYIHVIRNPLDSISSGHLLKVKLRDYKNNKKTLDYVIGHYIDRMNQTKKIKSRRPKTTITVYLEELIANPTGEIRRMLKFLNLKASDAYLKSCAALIFKKPNDSFSKVKWEKRQIEKVYNHISSIKDFEIYLECIKGKLRAASN